MPSLKTNRHFATAKTRIQFSLQGWHQFQRLFASVRGYYSIFNPRIIRCSTPRRVNRVKLHVATKVHLATCDDKTLMTFQCTGWFIGILLIAYEIIPYNPYITGSGVSSPQKNPTHLGVLIIAHLVNRKYIQGITSMTRTYTGSKKTTETFLRCWFLASCLMILSPVSSGMLWCQNHRPRVQKSQPGGSLSRFCGLDDPTMNTWLRVISSHTFGDDFFGVHEDIFSAWLGGLQYSF